MTKLDDLMAQSTLENPPEFEAPQARLARMQAAATTAEPQFAETCPKCRGTGQFRSYSGRAVGQCFTCKGRGQRTFKTAPEVRQANRERVHARHAAKVEGFVRTYPDEMAWINAKAATFNFAAAMAHAVAQYGELTERQLETVQRLMAQDAERDAARAVEREQRAASAPEVSVAAIETAFATAQQNGLRFPKLRLDTFTFSLAGANSKNAGAIYVKEGGDYLGKMQGGKFFRVRTTTDEQERRIVVAAADPDAAARAYGLRTGSCSCCGRELTNKVSIDLGIGPICRAKYGWA